MTRKLVRRTLLALIGLAAFCAALPSLTDLVKVETKPTSSLSAVLIPGTCAENNIAAITLVVEYDQTTFKACSKIIGTTGWDVLNEFGAKPQGTEQYPVGFVCKLFDYPAEQDCTDTPQPNEGVWNYFYATAELGNNWIYAATGASIRKPKCGDVEAWVFEVPNSNDSAAQPTTPAMPVTCK